MTQKRGLGRGLGALIPGAGSTPAPDQGLRTRTQRPSNSSGESGSTRPVDMFFSGERVEREDEGTQRERPGTHDLATGMARAAAERRGRTAGASSRRSSSSAGGAAATEDAAAKGSTSGTKKAPATRKSTGTSSTSTAAAGSSGTRTSSTKTSAKPSTKSSAKPSAKSSTGKAPAKKAPASKSSTEKSASAKTSTSSTASAGAKTTIPGSKTTGTKSAAATSSSPTPSTSSAAPAEDASPTAAPAGPAAEESAPESTTSVTPEAVTPDAVIPEAAAPETATAGQRDDQAPADDDAVAEAEETNEDSPVVDVEAVTPTAARVEAAPTADPSPQADAPVTDAPPQDTTADEQQEPERRGLVSVPGAEFAELPIHEVRENPRNPRTMFDDDELDELAYSLREVGVLQPVVVRPIPVTEDGESFELVMGERRWRAARRAGLSSIPAIIRETSDDDLLRDALLENLHRSQLNPLEEANAYQQLLDDFGCTQDELGDRIGRSRPQITNTLRLLRLPALVQRRLASGAISAGHARALLSLDDPRLMEELAQRIVQEGLSVRAVERLVARGGQQQGPRTVRRSTYDPHVVDLTSRLSNRLEAPVKIDVGKRKGRITLEFTNLEDLERLVENMGLDVPLPAGEHAPEN